MGAGFIRRYSYFPSVEEISAIEGVVIVDTPPQGRIEGTSTAAAVVGEFQDMSYACTVNTSGEVVSNVRAVELTSPADLTAKVGGFDEHLGEFGIDLGNGWTELYGKRFSRLVAVPVDLISAGTGVTQYAVRCWRELPTCRSATDPTPIVPVQPAQVAAGKEFYTGSSYVRLAQKVNFTAGSALVQGIDGDTSVAGLPAASVTIVSSGSNFITANVAEGDVVVVGSINATAASQNKLCSAAGLCRVVSRDSATQLTVQRMDGSNFTAGATWAAGTDLAFRVYPAAVADTGGEHQLSEAAGWTVIARPLDATVAATTSLTPTSPAAAASGTVWEPLSGLTLRTHPIGSLVFYNQVHGRKGTTTNYPDSNATLQARYQAALDALLVEDEPANAVKLVTCARKDSTVQTYLKAHVLAASAVGNGRIAVISPPINTTALTTSVLASAAPGVGALRDERVIYSWPGCKVFVPDAVGTSFATADSSTTTDGVLDLSMDTFVSSLLSVLNPELNPGQANSPVPEAFARILGLQRGVTTLKMQDYILLKQYGVCALRIDRTSGPILQSGVTTSLTSGQTNINRRRFADYVQDALASRYNQLSKQLGTRQRKDSIVAETEAFGASLLSENNPAAQRIESFGVSDKAGNTPDLNAAGIYVVTSQWRMLQTLDVIVAQTEVGPSVTITVT